MQQVAIAHTSTQGNWKEITIDASCTFLPFQERLFFSFFFFCLFRSNYTIHTNLSHLNRCKWEQHVSEDISRDIKWKSTHCTTKQFDHFIILDLHVLYDRFLPFALFESHLHLPWNKFAPFSLVFHSHLPWKQWSFTSSRWWCQDAIKQSTGLIQGISPVLPVSLLFEHFNRSFESFAWL